MLDPSNTRGCCGAGCVFLADRTKVIREELGSMPPVLEEQLTRRLARGIGPRGRKELAEALRNDAAQMKTFAAPDELEGVRKVGSWVSCQSPKRSTRPESW